MVIGSWGGRKKQNRNQVEVNKQQICRNRSSVCIHSPWSRIYPRRLQCSLLRTTLTQRQYRRKKRKHLWLIYWYLISRISRVVGWNRSREMGRAYIHMCIVCQIVQIYGNSTPPMSSTASPMSRGPSMSTHNCDRKKSEWKLGESMNICRVLWPLTAKHVSMFNGLMPAM